VNEIESLGKYLKKEREIKNISLKEVSKNIKVREQFLRAVEEDRYDLLPSPTYVKGFLSAYGKYLGLDPNEVVLRYENFLKGEPASRPEVSPEEKILWNRKYFWIAGGVIVAGLFVIYILFFQPPKPTNPSKPSVGSVSPKIAAKEASHVAPPSQVGGKTSVSEEKPLSLRLKAVERSWVSIEVDDQPKQEITLQPGEGISYRAVKRIRLIVGNVGGLDFIFNEKRLERFGGSGEVFTLVFTSQGVEAKRREKEKPPGE
jgi:cytoskeletal protein RodZ